MQRGRGKPQWTGNTVGPFHVLRRLRGTTSKEAGRVYVATHGDTGRPALLWRPEEPGDWAPGQEWRLRLRSTTTPPALALEVERAPGGTAPLTELADGLDALAEAMQAVERHPGAAAHLTGTPPPRRRRSRWQVRAPYAAALTTAALAALLVLPRTQQQGTPAQAPEGSAVDLASEAVAAPTLLPVAATDARTLQGLLLLDMPREPFPRQYRVDANGRCKARRETPINGGCWVALKGKAPCGEDAYEWKGECYWPSIPAAKDPSSAVGPRTAPVPARPAQ